MSNPTSQSPRPEFPSERTNPPGAVFVPNFPLEQSTYSGHGHETVTEDGLSIERDIEIELSDGTRIYADLIRPEGIDEPLPVLLAWSPYGKHNGINLDMLPGHEIDPANVTKHYRFEAAEPTYWCEHGYALLFPDPRGTWASEGQHSLFGKGEAIDAYEVIEWAAAQPWSTGKIGMIGQSYFSMIQWKVAALRPPHLTCIAPWGGALDVARHLLHHGGIPETVFFQNFTFLANIADHGPTENLSLGAAAHPFRDAFWENKSTGNLEEVEIPAYVVADWTDAQIHSPGTMDGWSRISSTNKWLEINGRSKWARFVEPEHADRLRQFYDTYLKDLDRGIGEWPRVRIEVREGPLQGTLRDETEWPLARTQYRPLYLAPDGKAAFEPATSASAAYDAETGQVSFSYSVTEELEVTGFAKLRLWVEADGSDDMDLFVAMRRLDAAGNIVHYPLDTIHRNGEAALGWLRVSHRTLDHEASTDSRPVLAHDRELRLAAGEVVPVDIELRPSSTLFHAGDTLQIVVQGDDFAVNNRSLPGVIGHTSLRNAGRHIIHLGGDHDSHLLLPVVPPR